MPSGVYKRTKWHYQRLLDRNFKEENHPGWKGDKVGIERLHVWVQQKLGKPKLCMECGTTKAKYYDWANISKTYKRDLSDYKRLCRKCHRRFDKDTAPRGENAPWSKLKEWQVLNIRKEYIFNVFGYKKLAKKYNLSPATIAEIVKREIWAHI